jgi:hypothetical protein
VFWLELLSDLNIVKKERLEGLLQEMSGAGRDVFRLAPDGKTTQVESKLEAAALAAN